MISKKPLKTKNIDLSRSFGLKKPKNQNLTKPSFPPLGLYQSCIRSGFTSQHVGGYGGCHTTSNFTDSPPLCAFKHQQQSTTNKRERVTSEFHRYCCIFNVFVNITQLIIFTQIHYCYVLNYFTYFAARRGIWQKWQKPHDFDSKFE